MLNPTPARAVSPGVILCRELDARDWTIRHLSTLTGVAFRRLWGVAYYAAPIDQRVAIALSDAFGTSVEFWLNLQADYDRVCV